MLEVPPPQEPCDLVSDLLRLSGHYEAAVVPPGTGFETLAVIGLVARARRIARTIASLTADGELLESYILLRVLLEYQITLAWIVADRGPHLRQWLFDDLRNRLLIDDELRELGEEPILDDEARLRHTTLQDDLRRDLGGEPPRIPSVYDRAKEIGLSLGYTLAYRFDSQSGIHPTCMAAEMLMLRVPQTGQVMIRRNVDAKGLPDPYPVTAALLLSILEAGQELAPTINLDEGFETVKAQVLELAPRAAEM